MSALSDPAGRLRTSGSLTPRPFGSRTGSPPTAAAVEPKGL